MVNRYPYYGAAVMTPEYKLFAPSGSILTKIKHFSNYPLTIRPYNRIVNIKCSGASKFEGSSSDSQSPEASLELRSNPSFL
jgi:hypothetical protein